MKEQIIDYSHEKRSNWFRNKCQGLVNRYSKIYRWVSWKLHLLLHPVRLDFTKVPKDSIPVIINNYNRLSTLRQMLQWLRNLDHRLSIIILDNNSSYSPLLDFYKTLSGPNIQVVYLGFNSWRLGITHVIGLLKHYPKYIITDPDLLPYSSTPSDLITHLSLLLDKYPNLNHIGTSLEIEDLPGRNPLTEVVKRHESSFWLPYAQKLNDEIYLAPIDTTFAMYRSTSSPDVYAPAGRTDRPYTLRHVDWYYETNNYPDEYRYYLKTSQVFATWANQLKEMKANGIGVEVNQVLMLSLPLLEWL